MVFLQPVNILREYYPKQYDEYLSNRNRRIKKAQLSDLTVLHIFFVSEMGCYTVNKCWGLSQNNVLCYPWQNKMLFVFFCGNKTLYRMATTEDRFLYKTFATKSPRFMFCESRAVCSTVFEHWLTGESLQRAILKQHQTLILLR